MVGEKRAVGIAIKADTKISFARHHFRGHGFRMQRTAFFVDVAPIGGAVNDVRLQAAAREDLRRQRARGPIGAVNHGMETLRAGNGMGKRLHVGLAQMLIARNRKTAGNGRRKRMMFFEQSKDFGFNLQLDFVRQLVAITAENFNAIVLPGIVRRGDHDAGGKSQRASEISDSRRGNYPGALHMNAGIAQPGGKYVGDPPAGFARVLANHDAALLRRHMVAQSAANGIDSLSVERKFTGNTANAVSPKKFSQYFSSSLRANLIFYSPLSTSAVNVPRETRAEILSPCLRCSESFTRAPLASKISAYPRSRIFTGESAWSRASC